MRSTPCQAHGKTRLASEESLEQRASLMLQGERNERGMPQNFSLVVQKQDSERPKSSFEMICTIEASHRNVR